ncbi:hypothetical protein D3C86_2163090 [compost metagenome]
MPGMPDRAVGIFDVKINTDFAEVMGESTVGDSSCPGFGLSNLSFRLSTGR